jgi:hypothetical protein
MELEGSLLCSQNFALDLVLSQIMQVTPRFFKICFNIIAYSL